MVVKYTYHNTKCETLYQWIKVEIFVCGFVFILIICDHITAPFSNKQTNCIFCFVAALTTLVIYIYDKEHVTSEDVTV